MSNAAEKKQRRPARLGDRLNEAFAELGQALAGDAPIDSHFTVRTVERPPEPGAYGPEQIRAIREAARVSQTVFAWMVGASPALVRAWELGTRQPNPMARRLLDQVSENPAVWRDRIFGRPVRVMKSPGRRRV